MDAEIYIYEGESLFFSNTEPRPLMADFARSIEEIAREYYDDSVECIRMGKVIISILEEDGVLIVVAGDSKKELKEVQNAYKNAKQTGDTSSLKCLSL